MIAGGRRSSNDFILVPGAYHDTPNGCPTLTKAADQLQAQSLDRDLEEPKRWHWVSRCSYTFIGCDLGQLCTEPVPGGLNLVFTLLAVCIFWDDAGGISNPVTDNLGDGAAPAVRC